MESFSNNGLFPEQIWDTADIPSEELYFGKHTNSAMPLVWAHAEYIKLSISLKERKVFDMPEHGLERYIKKQVRPVLTIWSFEHPVKKIRKGLDLRIETRKLAVVHWSPDHWENRYDLIMHPSGLGTYFAHLSTSDAQNKSFVFTFYWKEEKQWEGKDFEVEID
jgi:glucoamylase